MNIQPFLRRSSLIFNSFLLCSATLLVGCGGTSSDSESDTVALEPTPTATPTPELSADLDGDGVIYEQDQCLGTLSGIEVDSKGCEVSKSIQIVGDCKMSVDQQNLLTALNAARAKEQDCGAAVMPAATALNWDCRLVAAADGHADDMAANNYFATKGANGSSYDSRIKDAGYVPPVAAAEINAAGYEDAQSVVDYWMSNTGDCLTIMRENYLDVGDGFGENANSEHGQYWTANFGALKPI